jgi:hypothetical protein
MMNEMTLREIVRTVLFNHPPECTFTPNAFEQIIQEVRPYLDNPIQTDIVGAIERAVLRQEIYCPHEGIDRRSEYDQKEAG